MRGRPQENALVEDEHTSWPADGGDKKEAVRWLLCCIIVLYFLIGFSVFILGNEKKH
jgi:hypothetical protein